MKHAGKSLQQEFDELFAGKEYNIGQTLDIKSQNKRLFSNQNV